MKGDVTMYRITWKDGEQEVYVNKKDFENRLYFLDMICGYVEEKDYHADRVENGVIMDWHEDF